MTTVTAPQLYTGFRQVTEQLLERCMRRDASYKRGHDIEVALTEVLRALDNLEQAIVIDRPKQATAIAEATARADVEPQGNPFFFQDVTVVGANAQALTLRLNPVPRNEVVRRLHRT